MNTPNWNRTFRHSVDLRQFRTEQNQAHYRAMIDKLLEEGGSFAVCDGHLWLSDFSLAVCKDWLTLSN